MDISSLLSSDKPPTPVAAVKSPRKPLSRNLSGPVHRAASGSPLVRSSATPSIPPHAASPSHRPVVASPLVSPTVGNLVNSSPPQGRARTRQSSTTSMDALAEVAAMQNHQPQRHAPPSLRSKDSYESQLSPSTIYPLVQQTAAQASSRTSLDIAMSEGPRIAIRTDYSTTSLCSEKQATARTLASALQQNPHDYQLHSDLVSFLHKAFVEHVYPTSSPDHHGDPQSFELLQDLRTARENMDKMFALGENHWADWVQDESMLTKNVDDKIAVMEKCTKAVSEEYGSVKLWLVYGEWIYHTYQTYHDPGSAVSEQEKFLGQQIFSRTDMIKTWQTGAEHTMYKMDDGHLIWNRYIEFLVQDLKGAPSDEVTRIRSLFEARLQTPHRDWDGTFQLFSTFVSTFLNADYEHIMVSCKRKSQDALRKYGIRQEMELMLSKAQESGDRMAEYTVFANYVKWERTPEKKKTLSIDLTNAIYQRAELRFPSDAKLWEDHVLYLLEEGHANRSSQTSLPLLDRATRHCPWSGTLWAQYLLSSEREGQTFSQTEDIKHKATNTGLLDVGGMEEVIKVHTAWCTFLRRRAFLPDATDEELDVAEMGIRSSIENVHELAVKTTGQGGDFDPLFRLERIYIRFLSESGSWDTARETFRGLIAKHGDSWEFWFKFYIWEMSCSANFSQREKSQNGSLSGSAPVPHYATAVLRQAIQRETLDWPEKLMSAYITHCEDHEDVEELQMAIVEVRKMEKVIAQRRETESQKMAAAKAEADIIEPMDREMPNPALDSTPRPKRKRDGDDVPEAVPVKKARAEEVNGSHADPPSEKLVKRDRENTTILVQNLSNDVTETKLRQYFGECGAIKSLKVVQQNGTSAVIEFEEKEGALYAQTRNGRVLGELPLDVQLGSGSTLFVTNFPPTADEAYVRDLFDRFGEIVDIRFPSLKYNTHRRFCYVQFKLNAQAQAATELDDSPVGDNLKLTAKISNPLAKQDRSGALEDGREVYCKNLHWSASENDVKVLFSKYGEVESVRIPRNMNGKSKGFGFVVFATEDQANAATEMNGHSFMSRDLHVETSSKHGAKRQATTIISKQGRSNSPMDGANGAAESPSAMSTTSSHYDNTIGDRRDRTLALMNVPDTVNDSRIRLITEKFGELVKISLRPDHQGAIIEYADAIAAGKASLELEGHELAPGRRLLIGTVADLLRYKAEVKTDKPQVARSKRDNQPPKPAGPIKRPGQQAGRRGGLGQKQGLGFKAATKVGAGDGESAQASGGRSNDDFRQFLGK